MFAHICFCCFSSGVWRSAKGQGGQQGTGTSLNTSASFIRAQESSPRLYPCGLDQIACGFKVFLEDIFFPEVLLFKEKWEH